MTRHTHLTLTFAALLALVVSSTGCDKLKARDHLNKGVQAYKASKYGEAVEHFRESVRLDPTYPTARLYLATAYMNQWIPGAESAENRQFARSAEDEFQRVLEKDAKNSIAMASIASIHYNSAKGLPKIEDKLSEMEVARQWYERLAAADPKNKEAFYSLGVITWERLYSEIKQQARTKLGMKPEDPGPLKDKKLRDELKAKHMPAVDQGIQNLQHALDIDSEYDDAMAYMNLMLRIRADLRDTVEEARADNEAADKWTEKTLETKKIKAARAAEKAGGGIVIDPTK